MIGPSPRLWGTLGHFGDQGFTARSIPTPVGNANVNQHTHIKAAVHPHACGERQGAVKQGKVTLGPSPRLWGTPSSR